MPITLVAGMFLKLDIPKVGLPLFWNKTLESTYVRAKISSHILMGSVIP